MRRSRFCLQLQGQLQEGCLLRILFYQTKETANEVRGMNSLKKLFAQVDMTEGRPWEKIVLFTIPMIIGNVAQQLYNTVDSIVVGRYVGDNALAAVGSASPILNLLLVLFIGISMGASIMVSQYFGSRDRENLSRTIGSVLTLTAASAVFLMIVGSVAIRPILELLNTPASIIDWCSDYLFIMMYGIAGVAYIIFSAVF